LLTTPNRCLKTLKSISEFVVKGKADLGFVVDPDVDRSFAIVCEDGTMFGEEYTLVSVQTMSLKNNSGKYRIKSSSTKRL